MRCSLPSANKQVLTGLPDFSRGRHFADFVVCLYDIAKCKMVAWVTLLQTGLYLFLFTILQLQDYALLAGSIGLFVILAIIMRASQQIKWYAEG
jgi:hypothetical protein